MVRVNDPEAWQKVKNWWRFGKPVTDAALKKEVEQKKEELKANLRAMDGREYSEAKIDCMDTREVLYTYDRYRLGVDAGVARSRPDMPDMPAMSAMGGMIPPRGLYVDVTGKVHGDLPKRIPKEWSKEDLRDSADALKKSIQTRQAEQVRLGEDAGHRLRLNQERALLRQILKKLSGS